MTSRMAGVAFLKVFHSDVDLLNPVQCTPSAQHCASSVGRGTMAPMTTGHSSRAEANRSHILDVALAELLRDPDASMDQIARAAGVVRRTVYGHFPSREALISTLVDGAVEAVAAADAAGREGIDDLAQAVAGSVLAVWKVADRYRILVALAQRSVTMEGIIERLAPVRQASTELLQRGLDEGVFVSPLPAPALAYVHEQMMF